MVPRAGRRIVEPSIDLGAQVADRARQLVAARRRLAQPERDGRRRALRVGDPDVAARDLQDAPRRVAELEDVAGVALDREVLVERADERVVRLEDDAVVGDLGDRAARRLGEEPRAAAAANGGVDLVAVHQRRAAAAAGGEAVGRHLQHAVERRALEARDTARRASPARTARLPRSRGRRTRRRSAAPARRAARRARRWRRAGRDRIERSSAAHSTRSSRDTGNTRPFGVPAIVWPERPTRCSSVAIRCGDPIWQTRSTWPMSMPSSSDAVATSAFSCPDFSRVSASSRFSFDRLP